MHAETNFDSKLMYMSGYPDKETGAGLVGYGGWNRGERKQDAVDAFLRGGFDLFGRQHEMMFGGSFSRQRNHYDNTMPDAVYGMVDVGNFKNWNGNNADPQWTPWKLYSKDDIRQSSAYSSARFSLADPLHLILGRVTPNTTFAITPLVRRIHVWKAPKMMSRRMPAGV